MPTGIANRNMGSGGLVGSEITTSLSGSSVFKVKLLSVDGRLEQKPFSKDDSSRINSIKVGDLVKGSPLGKSGTESGRVLQINQANDEIVSYKVLTDDGKDILIDPTTITKNQESEQAHESSHVMSYNSWLNESR